MTRVYLESVRVQPYLQPGVITTAGLVTLAGMAGKYDSNRNVVNYHARIDGLMVLSSISANHCLLLKQIKKQVSTSVQLQHKVFLRDSQVKK